MYQSIGNALQSGDHVDASTFLDGILYPEFSRWIGPETHGSELLVRIQELVRGYLEELTWVCPDLSLWPVTVSNLVKYAFADDSLAICSRPW